MKIIFPKLIIALAAAAAALCFGTSASWAYNDAKWCVVTDGSSDNATWDCEFDTIDDCRPALMAGTRGFCALNPTYQPPAPPPQPLPTDPQH